MNLRDRFDRFTPQARNVLSLAQEESQRLNHNYIGTEHLLLGLVRIEKGVSATVFKNLGVELEKVRSVVEFIIGRGDRIVLGEIGLTPRSKKVIELSVAEASLMEQDRIGPEHILLGLVREGEGIAAGVLKSIGLDLWKVRDEAYSVLGLPPPEHPPEEEPQRDMKGAAFAFSASGTIPARPPMMPGMPLGIYQPWHIDAAQPEKTPVGTGATPIPGWPGQPDKVFGTLLGWVIVNTGGTFTLTLYDGLAEDAPALAIISQPPTGAYFPFHCLAQQGLTYTLEGTPGSVTIMYYEARRQ
jgi:hypothetical protein